MKLISLLAVAVLAVVPVPQQPPTNTEVFLVEIGRDGKPAGTAVNITNSPGYDNQPSFLPDGSAVLFASDRAGQSDIFKFTIGTKAVTQVTSTTEREYSPTVTPDGKTFSVIRVEADNAQRLWRFDLDGTNPRLVLERINPVGYHAWVDATHLALFVLGGAAQPNTLQLADTGTGAAEVIDSGIGRSLLARPGAGTVSYVVKPQGGHWLVKEFDPRTKQTATLTETADANASEDCAWLPDGTLLMSSGTKVMTWRPGGAWTELADFSTSGLQRITRLAVSRGGALRLALVAEPVQK
jgi:hypothetical protein